MSEWKKMKLGELYEVHNGLSKGRQFFSKGFPFLTFSNVFNNWFLPEKLDSLVQTTEKEREVCSIKAADVFITRTSETMDELGMSSVALKDYPNATYNGFTKRLRPITDRVNPRFIGYYLRTPKFRGQFMAFSTMTTRASLANNDLLNMIVEIPPKESQHRISTILSRYDSLIENYQKQIKLLEEAAQRLYKEWFVDLRFPGYENTPVMDGVPEGWEKNRLENLVFGFGKRISRRNRYSYYCYIPIDCLPKKQITYININSVEQAESSLIAFSPGDIIFGAMRPYFHKVCIARHYGITRTTCFVLRAKESEYDAFASMLLFNEETVKYASSISVGTTMPYTRWNDFKNMAILVPPIEIARKFNNVVLKNLSSIGRLANQLSLLTEARDRLLPKLMSGEIEV